MSRLLLAVIALLALLLAIGRFTRPRPEPAAALDPRAATATQTVGSAAHHTAVQDPALPGASLPVERPSVVEIMARAETRRRLENAGGATYIDSLLLSSDSTLRRWPDGEGPLTVALVPAPLPEFTTKVERLARDARGPWEATGAGIRFQSVADTTQARIVVGWVDRSVMDRAGLSEVRSDLHGAITFVRITLALRSKEGQRLTDADLLAAATHEFGHALGLPHSPSPSDVMYYAPRAAQLSPRDLATLSLLYSLPSGSVRLPTPQ